MGPQILRQMISLKSISILLFKKANILWIQALSAHKFYNLIPLSYIHLERRLKVQ